MSMKPPAPWAILFVALFATAATAQKEPNPVVVVETNVGSITIELFRDRATVTVENSSATPVELLYGTISTGVKGFMLQGGGFTPRCA